MASRTKHISRDSLLPFGSCRLCLLPARDPVSCQSQGHLFCRECAIANLLAQKKELRRVEKEWEAREEERREEESIRAEEERARDAEDFERRQGGGAIAGMKRREDMVDADRDWAASKRARVEGKDDRVSSSFWVPGEQRTVSATVERPKKTGSICPASRMDEMEVDDEENNGGDVTGKKGKRRRTIGGHDFSRKTMVDVHFSEEPDSTPETLIRTCPACKKLLSNTTGAIMAKPCGHIVCKTCAARFLKPPERHAHDRGEVDEVIRCYVCSGPASETTSAPQKQKGDLKEDKKKYKDTIRPGIVEISCDGTGSTAGEKKASHGSR